MDFCSYSSAHLIENHSILDAGYSMLDSGCLILEKSFTAENPPNDVAGKRRESRKVN